MNPTPVTSRFVLPRAFSPSVGSINTRAILVIEVCHGIPSVCGRESECVGKERTHLTLNCLLGGAVPVAVTESVSARLCGEEVAD
jgi:hypothetical protein